jgi:hypothetical protein
VPGLRRGVRAPLGEFGQVPWWNFLWVNLLGQAVPNLLDQLQSISNAELVNSQRLDTH